MDKHGNRTGRGWIGYDGSCGICSASARRWRPVFERRGFRFVPLQDPWLAERLGLRPGEPPDEMKLLLADGRVFGGSVALVWLGRAVWWLAPLAGFASLPGVRTVAAWLYRRLAARRHRVVVSERFQANNGAGHHRRRAFLDPP